jgi:hypothetical protein
VQPSLQSRGVLQPTVAQLEPPSLALRKPVGLPHPSVVRTRTDRIFAAALVAGRCAGRFGGSGRSQAPKVWSFVALFRKPRPGLARLKRTMDVFIGVPLDQQRSCQGSGGIAVAVIG